MTADTSASHARTAEEKSRLPHTSGPGAATYHFKHHWEHQTVLAAEIHDFIVLRRPPFTFAQDRVIHGLGQPAARAAKFTSPCLALSAGQPPTVSVYKYAR